MNRREFIQGSIKLTTGLAVATVGSYQYGERWETQWLQVERVNIPLKKLHPDLHGFKIVSMGDFHLFPYTTVELIKTAIELANSLQPDLVLLVGDYVLSTAKAIFELLPILAQLNPRYGAFGVLGNHDVKWRVDDHLIQDNFKQSGWPLLINQGVTLPIGGSQLNIVGLDDGSYGQPDLHFAMRKLPTNIPTILLIHEPDFVDTYALDGRISLQLSGHTHGGQVRLPGLGALVLPRHGKKYQAGLYRVKDTWLYVTRGIGVVKPAIRLNCRPEVTLLTLVAETS